MPPVLLGSWQAPLLPSGQEIGGEKFWQPSISESLEQHISFLFTNQAERRHEHWACVKPLVTPSCIGLVLALSVGHCVKYLPC